jgi:hypothetical protein
MENLIWEWPFTQGHYIIKVDVEDTAILNLLKPSNFVTYHQV